MTDETRTNEKRPVNKANEAAKYTSEAAEFAEYIWEYQPEVSRDEHMNLLVELIDQAHIKASDAYFELDQKETEEEI